MINVEIICISLKFNINQLYWYRIYNVYLLFIIYCLNLFCFVWSKCPPFFFLWHHFLFFIFLKLFFDLTGLIITKRSKQRKKQNLFVLLLSLSLSLDCFNCFFELRKWNEPDSVFLHFDVLRAWRNYALFSKNPWQVIIIFMLPNNEVLGLPFNF